MIPPPAERRFGRPVGIRLRATLIATAVVAGALLGGEALLVGLVHRSLIGSLDAAGQARARDVAAAAVTGRQSATVASTGEESSVVQVVDSAGQVLAASPNSTGEPPLLTAPPSRPIRQVLTRTGLPIGDHGQAFRVVAQPVRLPTGPGLGICRDVPGSSRADHRPARVATGIGCARAAGGGGRDDLAGRRSWTAAGGTPAGRCGQDQRRPPRRPGSGPSHRR